MLRRSILSGFAAASLIGCREATSTEGARAARTLDLADLEVLHGGRIGVKAQDANIASWRADERFLYCSTFKMFLAAAVLQRSERGEPELYREVAVTAADMTSHAPVTEPAVGGTLSIERLCQAVVEVSDNPAANILIREIGGLEVLRDWYRSIGDETTTVDRMEPELNRPDGDKDTITPQQAVTNIRRLFGVGRPVLTEAHLSLLESWMVASPTGAGRIKAGVPAGWTVAHKTGTSGTVHSNDIGLIRPTSGDPIAIAIYYEGGPESTDEQRDAVIAEATRRALRTLGHD